MINDYVLVINQNGFIKFCNQSLLSKLKYEDKELYNININNILANKNLEFIKDVDTKKNSNIELIFYNKNRYHSWLALLCSRFDNKKRKIKK